MEASLVLCLVCACVCEANGGSGVVVPLSAFFPIGDQYTKDEFKRHKQASSDQSQAFMVEWTNYAITVAKQLGVRGSHTAKTLGRPLSSGDLDKFSDEQVEQLYELYGAATNPDTPNPTQNPEKETWAEQLLLHDRWTEVAAQPREKTRRQHLIRRSQHSSNYVFGRNHMF